MEASSENNMSGSNGSSDGFLHISGLVLFIFLFSVIAQQADCYPDPSLDHWNDISLYIGAAVWPAYNSYRLVRHGIKSFTERVPYGKKTEKKFAPYWLMALISSILFIPMGAIILMVSSHSILQIIVRNTAEAPIKYTARIDYITRSKNCHQVINFREKSTQKEASRCAYVFESWSQGEEVLVRALHGHYGTRIMFVEKANHTP
jgi:hypothetical protein